ncbi:MAG: CvpA family protein [Treponema sp.]|nr:CvpA family protein [Treponema sp.]
MTFSSIDICFALIILFFAVLCAIRGLINELFGKASLICALVGGIFLSPYLEPYILDIIGNALVSKILAFLLIFVVIFLVVCIIQQLVHKVFEGDILRGLDRTLGFVFGVFEGFVVVLFIIIVASGQKFYDVTQLFNDSFFYNQLSFIAEDPINQIKEITG